MSIPPISELPDDFGVAVACKEHSGWVHMDRAFPGTFDLCVPVLKAECLKLCIVERRLEHDSPLRDIEIRSHRWCHVLIVALIELSGLLLSSSDTLSRAGSADESRFIEVLVRATRPQIPRPRPASITSKTFLVLDFVRSVHEESYSGYKE